MKRTSRSFKKSGFTLVELLVVIAIFIIITSIAVFSNSQFNSSVILSNLAYEVALSIQQAQDYGVSVHSASSCSGESCFDYVYGVDFNTGAVNGTAQYTLFSNAQNGDGTYSYAYSGSNPISTFSIGKGFTIKKIICSGGTCPVSGTGNVLDIAFQRPDPTAYINSSSGGTAEICIQDPAKLMTRGIEISFTGQISVVNDTSCN